MSIQTAPQAIDRRSASLEERYREVRATSDRLTASLSPEDQMVQSCLEASPAKWHRAHTTWFFETFILAPHAPGYREFDQRFRYLFNSYYNAVGERPERATRAFVSRPSADDVSDYRAYVDRHMQALLAGDPVDRELVETIELGLNHEQQHQELIVTDIKHALWSNPLRPGYWPTAPRLSPSAASPLRWFDFQGGLVSIGHAGSDFAFDNEGPRHQVFLQPFRLASRLVTNAEYLQFIADGGYRTPTLWLSDGWDVVRLTGWRAPLYWEQRDDEWFCFTSSGMRAVAASEPVCHVSYFEADAYARWRSSRLATEPEWEHAAAAAPIDGNFLDSADAALQPASATQSSAAPAQLFGDVWEWTASAYSPYPGFLAASGALGEYNGKFMCNQYVLRGGSCATPRSHIRATYRNFFPPQTRWQFMGIRLANDVSVPSSRRSGARNGS